MSDKNSCSENFCQKKLELTAHLEAVLKKNQTLNLTSIKDLETGEVLHIEDSLAVLPELDAAPEGPLADLGSGAGYPGIPLAIITGRQTTLIEANKKKAGFLQDFLEASGLTNQIEVAAMRSEELVSEQKGLYAVVTARAVAELPSLIELATPLLKNGGHFIALKGRPEASELIRGDSVAVTLGLRRLKERSYTLSDEVSKRCVLVYKKTGESTLVLPRRPGMATKRPLA